MTFGNLADCMGVSPRFDLLQAAEGHVPAERCLVEVMPGLQLVPVGRLAKAVGVDRVTNQRVITQFQQLQSGFDEWMLLVRPTDLSGLSPLALAAPRMLLVVEPSPAAVTEAYATLKKVAAGADTLSIGLALAKCAGTEAYGLIANLQSVAEQQLGVNVELVSSVGETLVLGYDSGRSTGPDAFMDRLLRRAQQTQHTKIVRSALA